MRLSNKLLLASSNLDKYTEFKTLLHEYPHIELHPANEFVRNLDGLKHAEKYETYLDNAVAKARLINHASHYPTLADDSGLEVEVLGGKPGVKSHRYATPRAGLTQNQANIELLLKELQGKDNRSAKFVCTLALVIEGILIHATGVLEGKIISSARGLNGFGYDPVFIPQNSEKTLAEMSAAEKNSISHRAKAVQELMVKVKAHGVTFAKP